MYPSLPIWGRSSFKIKNTQGSTCNSAFTQSIKNKPNIFKLKMTIWFWLKKKKLSETRQNIACREERRVFRSQGDGGGQSPNRDWKTDSGGREGWGGWGRLLSTVHVTFPCRQYDRGNPHHYFTLLHTRYPSTNLSIQSLIWKYFTLVQAGLKPPTQEDYLSSVSKDFLGLLANYLFSDFFFFLTFIKRL